MAPDARRPGVAAAPTGLVRPMPVDPSGERGPTRGQAQGPRWRRTSRGFFVPVSVSDERPEQRILEQSVRLGPHGAVTGWAAVRLHGAGYVDGLAPDGRTRLPVPLCLGRDANVRGDDAVHLLRDPLLPEEIVLVCGIRCVTPERAVFDAMRTAPDVVEAVVLLDMAAAGEVTSLGRMRSYVASRAGWRGVPQVRAALGLATEHSWSPNETRMRMTWVREAGLPSPLVNRPIFDARGHLLGYPDLLDVEAGLVGEYDGADHRRAGRHSADVDREAAFRRHGLEVTRVTGPDLLVKGRVAGRILEARQRARWDPVGTRRWTVRPPDWWEQGPTLDEVLDHRDFMREARSRWGDAG